MASPDLVRQVLTEHVIPAVCSNGVQHLYLPADLGADRCVPPPAGLRGRVDHRHREPVLVCFITGRSVLWVEDRLAHFRAGDMLLVPPNVNHSHCAPTRTAVPTVSPRAAPTVLWLALLPFGAMAQFYQVGAGGSVVREMPWCAVADRHIFDATELLLHELVQRRPGYQPVSQGLLLEILGRVARAPMCPGIEASFRDELGSASVPLPPVVMRARLYIESHYDQPLSVADIARDVLASPYHLCHEFKHATGLTLMRCLADVRITAAKRLLETCLPVSRVASLVGFGDPAHFTRVFRRLAGQTPSEFRASVPQPPGDVRKQAIIRKKIQPGAR